MRALLVALLTLQPELNGDAVKGVVLRHDGTRAAGAVVRLACGEWRSSASSASDGSFAIDGAPNGPCVLKVEEADDASAGSAIDVPADRAQALSIILPRGVRDPRPVGASGLSLDLRASTAFESAAPRFGGFSLSGTASTSPGLSTWDPVARPDQWSTRITATRRGPWGTLFSGTVTSRRQVGPSTLLSDVTGVSAGAMASGALLLNPAPSSLIWDARLGMEKAVTWRGVDLTFFGEGYRSFQTDPADSAALPLPPSATKGLRTGTATRFGLKVGF